MKTIVGHSVCGDIDQLIRSGRPVRPEWLVGRDVLDSLLLTRMVDENRLSYSLEDLVCDEFAVRPWKQETQEIFDRTGDMADVPLPQLQARCLRDAWGAALLVKKFAPKVPPRLSEFTHRLAATVHRLGLAGGTLEENRFLEFCQSTEANTTALRKQLRAIAGSAGMTVFDPSNDHHIRELLFKRMSFPVGGRTPTGLPKVDAETLAELSHSVTDLLCRYSEWDKLQTTYAAGLQTLARPHGDMLWLEWHINPLGARTGRRSSQDPNSQNFPATLRRCFRSRFPGGKILSVDFSRLEVIVLAWLAGEERLLRWFTTGRGYIDVGKWLLGKTVEDGSPDYKVVKQLVLATHYRAQGKKAAGVLRKMGISISDHEAQGLQEKYLSELPGIGVYITRRKEELLTTGQVRSPVGRVRHLPCYDGEHTPGFWGLWNQAVNFPVQSFAGEITAGALCDVEAALLAEAGVSLEEHHRALLNWQAARLGLTAAPRVVVRSDLMDGPDYSLISNEVHDELVVDLHPRSFKRDADLVREMMCAGVSIRALCPEFSPALSVGVSVGGWWE